MVGGITARWHMLEVEDRLGHLFRLVCGRRPVRKRFVQLSDRGMDRHPKSEHLRDGRAEAIHLPEQVVSRAPQVIPDLGECRGHHGLVDAWLRRRNGQPCGCDEWIGRNPRGAQTQRVGRSPAGAQAAR